MKRTKFLLLSALLSISLTSCSINLSGIFNKPVECKHFFNVNEIEPTCTEKGKKVYTCELCNYSYSIDTPALEHDISDVYTYNNKYHYKTCSRCDEAFEKQDHIFVNGICICGYSIVSEGLKYSLNEDRQSYSVTGLGKCTETDIVIRSEYNGLPVTSIGVYAFRNCSFTSIVIPNSVTSIGVYAFRNCSSLTSIVIPNSVTSIGDYAFGGCSSLTSIVIPNSVTSIGMYAFSNCSSLTSIVIPNSVISISYAAFADCSKLTDVYFEYTEGWCVNETYLYKEQLENSKAAARKLTSSYVYYNWYCSKLTYTLNSSKDSYSVSMAYRSLCKMTDVVIPSEYNGLPVTSIGVYAFRNCSSLTSIVIPNSVISIGDSAFRNCSSLTSIVIPNSVTSIGMYAFYNCSSLTSIVIPNSVTSIGYSAFSKCSSLTSIVIPNSVTSIGRYAFDGCSSLTSIVIPNSVTSIGIGAFYNCSSLTSIVIPNSVTSIDLDAFSHCSSLTSIVIPNSVTSIDLYAFSYCPSLSSIQVDSNNPVYDSRDNCNAIIKTNTNTLIQGCKSTIIRGSVTSIGDYAFDGCSSLTSIVIPNTVTSIGIDAFSGCISLTIYCEAESKPSGWDSNWNYHNCPVVWGYNG